LNPNGRQNLTRYAGVEVLILVSYASGMPGFSPSEWLSDKLQVLRSEGQKVVLITSSASSLESSGDLKVIKIPSMSFRDYKIENPRKLESASSTKSRTLIPLLFAGTAGRIFDWLFNVLTRQSSDGRWSWVLMAWPAIAYQAFRNPSSKIFATGGPSSAHLASIWAAALSGREVILEFQDPFIGSEMSLKPKVMKVLRRLEGLLIGAATKTVFVTKAAGASAMERWPGYRQKIQAIYPGAWKVGEAEPTESMGKTSIDFVHLGTLYGSRNLDTFFEALDELQLGGAGTFQSVTVNNMGAIYLPQLDRYQKTKGFRQTPLLDRTEALQLAAKSDCLLLVQHADSRSDETIPYKFYDYLNLGLPVFGLVKSEELRDLLIEAGGYACKQGDTESTRQELVRVLKDFERGTQTGLRFKLDIAEQFRLALEK